jgi:predicted PurR-regulated permease PerM
VIYPRLIRRGIHLHPLAVILGVLAGAEMYGVAGMFLAVPTVAIASVVYRHWRSGDDVAKVTVPVAPAQRVIDFGGDS